MFYRIINNECALGHLHCVSRLLLLYVLLLGVVRPSLCYSLCSHLWHSDFINLHYIISLEWNKIWTCEDISLCLLHTSLDVTEFVMTYGWYPIETKQMWKIKTGSWQFVACFMSLHLYGSFLSKVGFLSCYNLNNSFLLLVIFYKNTCQNIMLSYVVCWMCTCQ